MKHIGSDSYKKCAQVYMMDEKRQVVLIKRIRTGIENVDNWFKNIEDDAKRLMKVISKTGKNDELMLADLHGLNGLREFIVPLKEIYDQMDLLEHRESRVWRKGDYFVRSINS